MHQFHDDRINAGVQDWLAWDACGHYGYVMYTCIRLITVRSFLSVLIRVLVADRYHLNLPQLFFLCSGIVCGIADDHAEVRGPRRRRRDLRVDS